MFCIVLVRPGSTDLDQQGRIKGTLDLPLNERGAAEVVEAIRQLDELPIEIVYNSPDQASRETAEAIAQSLTVKVRQLDNLHNLDHGLWQGKRIEEVKHNHPKVYRQWQEHPEMICPPEGETVGSARHRVETSLAAMIKKHKNGLVALVAPEPLASLVGSHVNHGELGDLWKNQRECGCWEVIDVQPGSLVHHG